MTKERHPYDYPYDAIHWKKQILASHNSKYNIWKEGSLASSSLQKMIKISDTSSLTEEIMTNNSSYELGHAQHIQKNNNNNAAFEFEHPIRMSSSNNHYLSVIAKMAPSPDWFSGFSGFNVINEETMTWYNGFSIETYPYDAGIDDGTTYYAVDVPTIPPQPITQFTINSNNTNNNSIYANYNGTDILPVAKYTCALVKEGEVGDYHPETIQTIDSDITVVDNEIMEYSCSFVNQWNTDRHPKHFPTGHEYTSVHWTKQILASHDTNYSMWREGSMASRGVEKLAELGGVSDILNELTRHGDIDYNIGYDKYLYNTHDPIVNFNPITMTPKRRYISILSKLAPSPDWFAGYHDFDTINEETNTWYRGFSIPLFPYDAGTEEGSSYATVNVATDPKEPISKFTLGGGDNVFMKGNSILCVASLVCNIIESTSIHYNEDNDDFTTPSIFTNNRPNTHESSTTTLLQQEDKELTTQKNKIAIIGATIGAVVAVLVGGVLVSMLFCQHRKQRRKSNDDNNSLPSYRKRALMIQKMSALTFQIEHDASTISTKDHHHIENNQNIVRLEIVQVQPSVGGMEEEMI